jgi:hypothetical protein
MVRLLNWAKIEFEQSKTGARGDESGRKHVKKG